MTPKDHGLAPRSTFPEDHLKLQVHLDRLQMADSAHVRTRFRLTDPEETFYLPAGWRGRSEESAERVAAYDAAISKFRAVVDARLKAFGGDPEAVAGEILTAPPKGGAVPHGDVVQVLNVFLSLGMVDVVFKGPATHLPAAERAAGAAGAQPGDRGRPAGSGDR